MGKKKISDRLIDIVVNFMSKGVIDDMTIESKSEEKNQEGSFVNIQSGGSIDAVVTTWIPSEESNKANEETIDLSKKIEDYLNWYYEQKLMELNNENYAKEEVQNMKDFIEKTACWYENRYPETDDINGIMFNKNEYIKTLLEGIVDPELLECVDFDWPSFYNKETYFKTIPREKYLYFDEPFDESKFRKLYLLKSGDRNLWINLDLSPEGIVTFADLIPFTWDMNVRSNELIGKTAEEVLEYFKDKNIPLTEDNELEADVKRYNDKKYQIEEMLNCIMYRIMERGREVIGPRRAYEFAKDFDIDTSIPIKYAATTYTPGVRELMHEYIKDGGNPDLECYIDYFERSANNKPIETCKLSEFLIDYTCTCTNEEKALHQRLVNALATQLPPADELKEKILQARIARKLEKSKKNR